MCPQLTATLRVLPGYLLRIFLFSSLLLPISIAIELPQEPFDKLRSEEFRIRENAQVELLTWARAQDESAMDEFYRLSRFADDPEIRERCLGILRELVNDEYLKDGEGYVGIQMLEEVTNVPGDPNPRGAVRVMFVAPDSPGQQAGLQPNDLIVGIGEEVWHEPAVRLLFQDKIRQFKPETKIHLKILRNGNMADIEVKLGRRPPIADNPFFEGTPEELEAAAKESHFRKWLERKKARN